MGTTNQGYQPHDRDISSFAAICLPWYVTQWLHTVVSTVEDRWRRTVAEGWAKWSLPNCVELLETAWLTLWAGHSEETRARTTHKGAVLSCFAAEAWSHAIRPRGFRVNFTVDSRTVDTAECRHKQHRTCSARVMNRPGPVCWKLKGQEGKGGSRLMHKILFYNKYISSLYMFRAPCVHRQEVKIVLYNLWYHHTCRWPSRARNGHL